VQLLLGHTKLESTVRYLGIEVDDALEIAEQTEVQRFRRLRPVGATSGRQPANCCRSPPWLDIREPVVQAQLTLGLQSTNIIYVLSTCPRFQ
jgi:hypothetical protein